MALTLNISKHSLDFKFPAGTSRGVLESRDTWFVNISNTEYPKISGLGECAPLRGLSIDDHADFQSRLTEICNRISLVQPPKTMKGVYGILDREVPPDMPATRFGLETAMMDLLNGGKRLLYKTSFSMGDSRIPINGLIWMGDKTFMLDQIGALLSQGFTCLKLKIGAIDFETECELLSMIRAQFEGKDLELRVDANGAFTADDARVKLEILSVFNLHSIEQPIPAGNAKDMRILSKESAVPISLDEELIGVVGKKEKKSLLNSIKPAYIVLKPSLVGGFRASMEWIEIAEQMGVGWWITSALESNIGLNAISQFTSSLKSKEFQGLGTGKLYKNNIPSPLTVDSGFLWYDSEHQWDLQHIGSP